MKLSIFLVAISLAMFVACGKKKYKNHPLAKSHYKLALVDLADQTLSEEVRYKKALTHIEKALEHHQKPDYQALKATILFKINHYEESLRCFKQALTCSASIKPEILNNYACVLAQQGKTQQAMALWQELMNDAHYLTPEVALVNQGKVCIENNNMGKAKHLFQQAISVEPGYLDAHYYLALAAYQLHDAALAKNEVSTVLFLEPSHRGARQLLTVLEKMRAEG